MTQARKKSHKKDAETRLPSGIEIVAECAIQLTKPKGLKHFIYTTMGDWGYAVTIYTVPAPPWASEVRDHIDKKSYEEGIPIKADVHTIIIFDLDKDLGKDQYLRDSSFDGTWKGRPHQTYKHAIVFKDDSEYSKSSPEQLYELLAGAYLKSSGAKLLGDAIVLLHEQGRQLLMGDNKPKKQLFNFLQALNGM
jgi:hypothetical protein